MVLEKMLGGGLICDSCLWYTFSPGFTTTLMTSVCLPRKKDSQRRCPMPVISQTRLGLLPTLWKFC